MTETPPYQRRATGVPVTLDVLAERLDNFREEYHEDRRDWREWVRRQRDQESDHVRAVERCASHGADIKALEGKKDAEIKALHERIDGIVLPEGSGKGDRVSFWTAVGAMLAACASGLLSIFGGKP